MRRLLPWLTLLACTPRSVPDAAAKVDSEVSFRHHKFDLSPFLTSYPYSVVLPIWEQDTLFVDVQGATRRLTRVAVDFDAGPPAPPDGPALNDVDWDTRNRWNMTFDPQTERVFWLGDENNNERINLWSMPSAGGDPKRLTDEPYHYGFSFSPDHSRIALVPRRGDGPYTSCLEVVEVATMQRTTAVCDTPAASLSWSEPSWSPAGDKVVLRINIDGKRDRANLGLVDLKTGSLDLLLDPKPVRTRAQVLPKWLDDATPILVTDDQGVEHVWRYSIKTAELTPVFDAKSQELRNVTLMSPQGTQRLVITTHSPVQDNIVLVDPTNGAEIARQPISGSTWWTGDDERHRALIHATSADSPFMTYMVDVSPHAMTVRPWLTLSDKQAQHTVRCDVKAVQFPTWDDDPATGQPRSLHAFLYTPKDGAPRSEQPVRVTAFYGGANTFSAETQIHCEAGISTFSPAVRGSWGFGPKFSQMNNGDLGGDEIVDLFYGARWLEAQGFSKKLIGLHGGSHGGYSTMRALTFPPGTNGHDAEQIFPFAFGVSRAGFSDIISFHDTCNIPDWVLLEAGDPESEADKLRDRSPLHHVDLLTAPLVMVHGENDSRVPVTESQQMAAACLKHDAPCTYVEFKGMGHHIKGIANKTRMYQAIFDVLGDLEYQD